MDAIGIVGWKNSGKTTVIAKLIPALRERGLSVSTIKHVHHDLDLDEPGKDTFVHREAGAVDVVMFSQSRWALLHEIRQPSATMSDLEDVMGRMTDVDLVLVEGFKNMPMRRIEVRGDGAKPMQGEAGIKGIIGVVADGATDPVLPTFSRDQIDDLAGFICEVIAMEMVS